MAKAKPPTHSSKKNIPTERNSRTTVGGPAKADEPVSNTDALADKFAGMQELVEQQRFNVNKPAEYEPSPDTAPPAGPSFKPSDPIVGSSTVTETNGSEKVGSGSPS